MVANLCFDAMASRCMPKMKGTFAEARDKGRQPVPSRAPATQKKLQNELNLCHGMVEMMQREGLRGLFKGFGSVALLTPAVIPQTLNPTPHP